MLLIRELVRLLGQTISFAVATRRPGTLALIALGLVLVVLSTFVATVGPVAIYPFL